MIQKKYKEQGSGGFTLIELLVVISIIGILSSLIVFGIFGAGAKARDAKRLSDIKQLVSILVLENTLTVSSDLIDAAPGVCTGGGLTTGCKMPSDATTPTTGFEEFVDPSKGDPCTTTTASTCGYSISNKDGGSIAKTNDYKICFYLEDPVSAGYAATDNLLKAISPRGIIQTGC